MKIETLLICAPLCKSLNNKYEHSTSKGLKGSFKTYHRTKSTFNISNIHNKLNSLNIINPTIAFAYSETVMCAYINLQVLYFSCCSVSSYILFAQFLSVFFLFTHDIHPSL